MRNAYVLINYGDFVEGNANSKQDPYVQMLPLTNNSAQAHADFVKARGNSATWSPKTDQTAASRAESWIKSHLGLVIGIAAGVGLLVLGLIVACCCCSGRSRRGRYAPIHDPVPPPAYDLHLVGNQQRPPGAPPAPYNSPWDSRY